jgi:hypothetical protein
MTTPPAKDQTEDVENIKYPFGLLVRVLAATEVVHEYSKASAASPAAVPTSEFKAKLDPLLGPRREVSPPASRTSGSFTGTRRYARWWRAPSRSARSCSTRPRRG